MFVFYETDTGTKLYLMQIKYLFIEMALQQVGFETNEKQLGNGILTT